MNEKVLETLTNLGFVLCKIDAGCYSFSYEGCEIIYVPNKSERLIYMTVACLICPTGLTKEEMYSVVNMANSKLRYTKAYLENEGYAWISFEREILDENEDLGRTLGHIIQSLAVSKSYMDKLMLPVFKDRSE